MYPVKDIYRFPPSQISKINATKAPTKAGWGKLFQNLPHPDKKSLKEIYMI